jgi:transcription-repair coupling factor (superfamily II helicase)
MPARELERTMWDFFNRRFDVLVASSIIESGLDIPTVNTLVVENAHEFGLAQLYQLRGRIGRERRRAVCLLLHPAGPLTEEARLRLEALTEFAQLGSGFHLAMRDLEIRGAGELLGARQHGFVTAVGLESYCELLKEETDRLRGRAGPEERPAASLDLSLPAYLPPDYLPDEMRRLDVYKRILAADAPGLSALRAELADVSGPPPAPVENLLRVARLRLRATRAGLRSAAERDGRLELHFARDARLPESAPGRWARDYGRRLAFLPSALGDGVRLVLERPAAEELDAFLSGLEGK